MSNDAKANAFFFGCPAAGDFMSAAFRAIDRGEAVIKRHDNFEIRVSHQIDERTSATMGFLAISRAKEAERRAPYLPYDTPEEEWIDEL